MTGRPRRTGWLDLPLLRYSNMINGTSWLVVTKLDVLDDQPEIPVCVGYKIDGKETQEIPAQASGYEADRADLYQAAGLAVEHVRHGQLRSATGEGKAIFGIRREGIGREGRHCFYRPGPRADDVHSRVHEEAEQRQCETGK